MNFPKQATPIQRAIYAATPLKPRGITASQGLGDLAAVGCETCRLIFPPGRDRDDCLRTCRTTTGILGPIGDIAIGLGGLLL